MKLYNSLSKSIEEFVPFNPDNVKIYVCGITPYDTTHLGHAFTYLFFDTLIRVLKYKGKKVIYTQNVTDINDRDNDILKKAKEQNVPWQNLATFWTDKFLNDMNALNWIMPDHFLWASAHIPAVIDLIERLLKNGFAYQVNGGVYLDIQQKKDFGKLSGFDENKMLKVAKEFDEDIDNSNKKHQLDITLWRPTVPNQSEHIPSFNSQFGPGRPGWHIECSAMAYCSLGEQIDIHGGGMDLIYPHHESEIAQSEGATGKTPFSKYWLHAEVVGYKGQKMSKSLGNLVLVSDLLKKYSPDAIRFMLLSHHYRKPWEFHEDDLAEAEKRVEEIKSLVNSSSSEAKLNREVLDNSSRHLPAMQSKALQAGARTINSNLINEFEKALEDDMNTPKALELILNTKKTEELIRMCEVLGFTFANS